METQNTQNTQASCLRCGSPVEAGNPEQICNKCYDYGELQDSLLAEAA